MACDGLLRASGSVIGADALKGLYGAYTRLQWHSMGMQQWGANINLRNGFL